jgi:RNA polymerase sigma-70 factor, ECF subfamily
MAVNRMQLFGSRAWLDERTFEAIFYEHYPRIYAALFRLVGDGLEADDLAAQTFWKLWEKPPAQDDNIAGWLYRVAMRIGYNALRSARRRAWYEQNAGRDTIEPQSPADPAGTAEENSERERVRAILRQLPMRDVQILILRNSGLSYKEIAAAAGVPPASIGSLLARAEAKFEAHYRRGEDGASSSKP